MKSLPVIQEINYLGLIDFSSDSYFIEYCKIKSVPLAESDIKALRYNQCQMKYSVIRRVIQITIVLC